jgi:hypothetical protein
VTERDRMSLFNILCRARDRFSELVGPLLDGLAAHTGYEISLLVGRVRRKSDNKLDIEAVR